MKDRRDVGSPAAISLRDWRRIVVHSLQRTLADNVGILAGGIAFYAFLSVFPAIAGAIMVWGLVTDMVSLGAQLEVLRSFAPDAFGLLADQMARIANQPPEGLSIGVVLTLTLTLWTSSRGVAALMAALNIAYKEDEKRSFIRVNLIAIGFTLAGILFVLLSLAAIAAVPPILEAVYLGAFLETLIRTVRWLLVIGLFLVASAAIYRYAPSREARAPWRWVVPGAVGAAILWSLASIAFSSYLANFNAYNATFGSLGAVAALLMWFWLSAYAICMGAQLNSQLELFTTRDTTADAPALKGQRGAFVADHVEDPCLAENETGAPTTITKPQRRERTAVSRLRSGSPNRKAKP